MSALTPAWMEQGQGLTPELMWSFATDAPLRTIAYSRESQETTLADEIGGVYRLDAGGRAATLTRLPQPIRELAWSDAGNAGIALLGKRQLVRLNRDLQIVWEIELPDEGLAVAVDPFGSYFAVSMTDGHSLIFNQYRRKVVEFETIRPLRFLRFLIHQPMLLASAEHGLLTCIDLNGDRMWEEKLWTNVGDLSLADDTGIIYLAGFVHGILGYDIDGDSHGSYQMSGTVKYCATSSRGERIAVYTIEEHLSWLDADGELVWVGTVPEPIVQLQVDALGQGIICAFASGRILCLHWPMLKGGGPV